MPVSRRSLLVAAPLAALAAAGALPGLSLAALPGDRRFVFVVLRGGMDGLHAVPPHGDRDYADARGALALAPPGEAGGVIDLDGFFGLHPALAPLTELYRRGEFLAVHAVASPYRERSHFDGQDVLESGVATPHSRADGWLNRVLAALHADRGTGLAIAQGIPLSLRGAVPVASWAPSPLAGLPPELVDKLRRLYADDAQLAMALDEGTQAEAFVGEALGDDPTMARKGGNFRVLAEAAGKLLAAPEGPRAAVIEAGGWDTHTGQGTVGGRMAGPLGQLGDGLSAMAAAMGPAWQRTVVVAASEFGRTVAANGTGGSDHGTAGAVLVAGGAVRGGRIISHWPGLAADRLYQGRDLAPTCDLRAVLKGLLRDHLGVTEAVLARQVFPDSQGIAPVDGLLRT